VSEKEAVKEIYEGLHRVSLSNKKQIKQWVGNGFNTSFTKVIDNSVVGFVWDELP
jgi:hypothetical protein